MGGLEIEKNVTFWYFRAGIAFFGISASLYIWIFFHQDIAIIVTVLLSIFLLVFFKYNHSIQKRFEIPEGCDTVFNFGAYSSNPMANMNPSPASVQSGPPVPREDLTSKKNQPGRKFLKIHN